MTIWCPLNFSSFFFFDRITKMVKLGLVTDTVHLNSSKDQMAIFWRWQGEISVNGKIISKFHSNFFSGVLLGRGGRLFGTECTHFFTIVAVKFINHLCSLKRARHKL